MGELFRRDRPVAALAWTGERLVTDVGGSIEDEHLHRYFLAREFCRDKDVLDVASGEGYGTALLAQTAQRVVGVEVDLASVEHASLSYRAANLRFVQGDATKLPLNTQSVDVVVSFETIEHLSEHGAFLAEVRRVLRPEGFLIISTPDINVYSALGMTPNPFHKRELTESEFRVELQACFCNISVFRQRVITGSAIVPDVSPQKNGTWVYEQRDSDTFESHQWLARAPYLIAVASNAALPPLGGSLYIQNVNTNPEVQAELGRLKEVEAAAREQAPIFAKAVADAESAREEVARLTAAVQPMQTELEHLRSVEAAMQAKETELERLRSVELAAREQTQSRRKERDEARAHAEALRQQVDSASQLARRQALALQRFEREARTLRCEVQGARDDTARHKAAYEEACSLIIPFRLRKTLPEPLKRSLRLMKRAIMSAVSDGA